MTETTEHILNNEPLNASSSEEVVLALHGVLSGLRYMGRTSELLEDDFQVMGMDLLGFAGSPKPETSDYTLTEQAHAVRNTLDTLQLPERFTLFGHSLGGATAARFAALHPEAVDRLILVASPIHESIEGGNRLSKGASPVNWFMATKPGGEAVHSFLFERSQAAHFIAKTFATRRELDPSLPEDFTRHTYRSLAMSIRSFLDSPAQVSSDIESALRADIPVAYVYGTYDRWVNDESKQRLAELEELGLQLHVFEGDHQLPQTHAPEIAEIVRTLS